jgi:hypothetical protein
LRYSVVADSSTGEEARAKKLEILTIKETTLFPTGCRDQRSSGYLSHRTGSEMKVNNKNLSTESIEENKTK